MAALAETITAAAINNRQTFPFVRVPMFEIPAQHVRDLSGVEFITFAPIVEDNQRQAWQFFVQQQEDIYSESLRLALGVADSVVNPLLRLSGYDTNSSIRNVIWDDAVEETDELDFRRAPGPDFVAPLWHCSPPPFSPSFLNYNAFNEASVKRMFPIMSQTRDGLMSETSPELARVSGIAIAPSDHDVYHEQFVEELEPLLPVTYFDHPHSLHMQPVFEELNNEDSKIVGILIAIVPWDRYLGGLLPPGVGGMVVVLHNTCGQEHTYIVDGRKVSCWTRQRDLLSPGTAETHIVLPSPLLG